MSRSGAAALLIVALFVAESLRGAAVDSQTSDEAVYIAAGYSFLRTGRILINPEHPPLFKAILAAPLLVLGPRLEAGTDAWRTADQYLAAYEFLWENERPGQLLLFAGRLPVIIVAGLLLGLIFLGSRRLYGETAGLLSLLAAATCPDFLGHGHLATLDVPLALASTLALAFVLSYAARPSRGRLLALAVVLGLTLSTKVSAVQLLPALLVACLVRAVVDPDLVRRGRVPVPVRLGHWPRLAAAYVLAGGLLVASVYSLLVLAVTYLGSPWALVERGVLPNAWLSGYGHPTYLFGEVRWAGFREYFAVALGVKLPLLTLALGLGAVVSWRRIDTATARIEATALSFAAAVLVLISFGPAQTGVRYALPIYPVLFVFLGRIARVRLGPRLRSTFGAVIVGAYVGVVLVARPSYLGYFNELVRSPEQGIAVLADSNVDWGQDLGRLQRWLEANGNPTVRLAAFGNAPPEAYGIRYQALPADGKLLSPPAELAGLDRPDLVCISANNLVGLFFNTDLYGWLREREPVVVLGSMWVYDLDGSREDHLRLAAAYAAPSWSRWPSWERWAAHERELALR